jgi:hypothetical protein
VRYDVINFWIYPKNAFIGVGLFFENRQEARKLGLLPLGKSCEAVCERLEPQERKERVFREQPDIDDFNCIIWVKGPDDCSLLPLDLVSRKPVCFFFYRVFQRAEETGGSHREGKK